MSSRVTSRSFASLSSCQVKLNTFLRRDPDQLRRGSSCQLELDVVSSKCSAQLRDPGAPEAKTRAHFSSRRAPNADAGMKKHFGIIRGHFQK